MSHHLAHILIQHPKLAGIFGLLIVLLFGVLTVSSLQEMSKLPEEAAVATLPDIAAALETQDRFWAVVAGPNWECSTLVHDPVGKNTNTEVFMTDPASSIAVLVTFTRPLECAALDPQQVSGVAYPMGERHKELLEQAGRLAPLREYRTLAEFCTTCGRQSSLWLAVIFGGIAIGGLAIYPVALWAQRKSAYLADESGFDDGTMSGAAELTYTARMKFDPRSAGWNGYLPWAKLPQLKEVISLDTALCPLAITTLTEADWEHNIQLDFRTAEFRDLDYLLSRVCDRLDVVNILAVVFEPDEWTAEVFVDDRFVFCGYDLVERSGSISALTNCGGFNRAFSSGDLSTVGLLEDYQLAREVQARLIQHYPDEPHADCDLWAIWRLEKT